MAFIKSTGINAKEEPNPKGNNKPRVVPHYLFIPESAYGPTTQTLSRTVSDPDGYFDKRTQKYKNQEVTYYFLRGQATPVWNEQHVHWLMQSLDGTGIVEVAWTNGPDKVEHFHPERTNPVDRRMNGPYKTDESFEVVTKTFKPVLTKVIRTADDIKKGVKMALTEKERKYSAEDLLAEEKPKGRSGK